MPDSTTFISSTAALFVSAYTSATLLPGTSEAALILLLSNQPSHTVIWIAVATLANTLGGMTSYLMGRAVPRPHALWTERLQRFGTPTLILSWVPVIGDALCLAAGTLRLPWVACLAWMTAGKLGRYLALAYLTDLSLKLVG